MNGSPAMINGRLKFFLAIVAFMSSFITNGQAGICPPNLDFESGTFDNWLCQTGEVVEAAGLNTVVMTSSGEVGNRHTIIDRATAGNDPYGGFPQSSPNGSKYCVQLGNKLTGREAEQISYTYTIPATATNFSMLFYFAVVFENPEHTPERQPRFRAQLYNVTDNAVVGCISFDYTASGALPGFLPSPWNRAILYKDWTPITVDLSAYVGKTIQLQFITSDCTQGAHFGYAYIDVSTACNGAIAGAAICPGINSVSLSAPFGFETYQWYSDASFSTPLAITQDIVITPAPAVGTVYPVVVTPYPGFGCRDTLYGKVYVATKPIANAGPDISFCDTSFQQLGAPKVATYKYEWTPSAQVDDPFLSNPIAEVGATRPTLFIVKTTDILTGCVAYDTTTEGNKIIPGKKYTDITVPEGGSLSLRAEGSADASFRWSPMVQLDQYDIRRPKFFETSGNDLQYLVYVTEQKVCTYADTLLVNLLKKPGYYLPSGFTPNGDGLNDVIKPYLVGMKSLKSFSVFNRDGTRIFYSTKYGEAWDGTYMGKKLGTGVYVWMMEYYDGLNRPVIVKGHLTLIR